MESEVFDPEAITFILERVTGVLKFRLRFSQQDERIVYEGGPSGTV